MAPFQITSYAPERDAHLVARAVPPHVQLVRIDGHSGVGKTRLSRALEGELRSYLTAGVECVLVDVDRYIVKDRPGRKYAMKVDQEALHGDVDRLLKRFVVIVDGLLLDHLLPPDKYGRGVRIYVKAATHESPSRDEIERRRMFGTDLYHKRYDPEATADIVIVVPYVSD